MSLDRVLLSDMSNGLFIVNAEEVLTATGNYPPLLVKMPESVERAEGSDVTFSVVVTGTAPSAYQWRRNGQAIDGENKPELILDQIELADGGDYSLIVSNAAGEIISRGASLGVVPPDEATPPQINSQPLDQVAAPGQTVTFSVTASGTQQLRYLVLRGRGPCGRGGEFPVGRAGAPSGCGRVFGPGLECGRGSFQ